jgi:hypothetical protein
MEETIHGYDLIGEDGGDGCGAEEPAKKVPPVNAVVSVQLPI